MRRALIPSGRDFIVSEPKTVKGRRVMALDQGTVEILKSQAARQLEEQRERDDAWRASVALKERISTAMDRGMGSGTWRCLPAAPVSVSRVWPAAS